MPARSRHHGTCAERKVLSLLKAGTSTCASDLPLARGPAGGPRAAASLSLNSRAQAWLGDLRQVHRDSESGEPEAPVARRGTIKVLIRPGALFGFWHDTVPVALVPCQCLYCQWH